MKLEHAEILIEELKKEPGMPIMTIERKTGFDRESVRRLLKKLEEIGNPETKKLLFKRKAYLEGGGQLMKILEQEPGIKYGRLIPRIKEEVKKHKTHLRNIDDLFNGLILYCKKYGDKKMKDIIVTHKKKGGWMP